MDKQESISAPWPRGWQNPEQIQWLRCGENFHSRVAWVVVGGEQLFLKVYGLPGREDRFTKRENAEALLNGVVAYRAALQEAGVRVPQGKDYRIEQDESGNFLLYVLESYEGQHSLGDLLAHCLWAGAETWVDSVIWIVAPLLAHPGNNGRLAVGIDPKPANFVVDGTNRNLTYVDLVWPLNANALDGIDPEIRPTWDFRYFSKYGVLLNVLIQFARQNTGIREAVVGRICEALHGSGLQEPFKALPGVCPIEHGLEALRNGNIPMWDVDTLRALGIQLAAARRADGPFLDNIFHLSRTNPHEPLPAERIRACRRLLLEA